MQNVLYLRWDMAVLGIWISTTEPSIRTKLSVVVTWLLPDDRIEVLTAQSNHFTDDNRVIGNNVKVSPLANPMLAFRIFVGNANVTDVHEDVAVGLDDPVHRMAHLPEPLVVVGKIQTIVVPRIRLADVIRWAGNYQINAVFWHRLHQIQAVAVDDFV